MLLDGTKNSIILEKAGSGTKRHSFFRLSGDYIYFSDYSDNGNIHRINLDGSNEIFISDGTHYMQTENPRFEVSDNYIFYTPSLTEYGHYLYRINLDGSDCMIYYDEPGQFVISDDYIYINDYGICKVSVDDNKNIVRIFDMQVYDLNIVGEYIYANWYNPDLSERKIYKIKNDGSMEYEILTGLF